MDFCRYFLFLIFVQDCQAAIWLDEVLKSNPAEIGKNHNLSSEKCHQFFFSVVKIKYLV